MVKHGIVICRIHETILIYFFNPENQHCIMDKEFHIQRVFSLLTFLNERNICDVFAHNLYTLVTFYSVNL